jgi:hypothetical protein
VEEVEGNAFRARGGEELNRNRGEPEVDVEILERARHSSIDTKAVLGS